MATSLCGLGLAALDPSAKALLLKCMQRTQHVNVRAIVSQKLADGRERRQVKVEQTASGKSRITVIAPIEDEGTEFVDDGVHCAKYSPDERRVVVTVSHRHSLLGSEFSLPSLISLAEANYTLASGSTVEVAGRKTTVVCASPRHPGLPARRFFIDSATGYLLRLETTDSSGHSTVSFDTLAISYPNVIEEPTANVRIPEALQISYDYDDITRRPASFRPVVPTVLPLGFIPLGTEPICKDPGSLAVRFSDGIVRGSVYEWRPAPGEAPPVGADAVWADGQSLRFLVLADVSHKVRLEVLKAFLAESLKGLSAQATLSGAAAGTNLPNSIVRNQ